MKYTFETKWLHQDNEQAQTSGQRFNNIEEASEAAAHWSAICFLNNVYAWVRVIEAKD